jgi:1-acyl-sn-glycerol-3-phosphate acyltransferase
MVFAKLLQKTDKPGYFKMIRNLFSNLFLKLKFAMEVLENKKNEEVFYIDLDNLINSQKSNLVKRLPRFIVSYLKRIIKQDELNRQLDYLKDKYDIGFIRAHIEYLNINLENYGLENLHETGRYIFACNHPLGAIDFYAALIPLRERYPVVKALANDILLGIKKLKALFLPVNAFGRSPIEYHQLMKEAYASEIQIMTFPSGEVSRKRGKEIVDGQWHRSFIRNAVEYQRNVIPVYIHARNSDRFYRLGSYRKKLGIKLNFELFLLPDEMIRQKNKTIQVVFGKPIPWQHFDGSKSHLEWAQVVKGMVYDLKNSGYLKNSQI